MKNLNECNFKEKIVLSLSGGLDSVTLLHLLVSKFGKDNVYALTFNYNQRHQLELQCAEYQCKLLGVNQKVINIGFLGDLVKNVSSMVLGEMKTPSIENVLGEPQPSTYVPFRNMILSSLSLSYAESIGAKYIALGIQKIDQYGYWDTTEEFHNGIQNIAKLNRKHKIEFITPFILSTKMDEIKLGLELGIDYSKTWTCYDPKNNKPCMKCAACNERENAFNKLNIKDPLLINIQE